MLFISGNMARYRRHITVIRERPKVIKIGSQDKIIIDFFLFFSTMLNNEKR